MRIEGWFKGPFLSALVIVSIVALAIPLLSTGAVHATFISHAPISINGNSQFDNAHGVNGGGNGTSGNPYIIENWDISAQNATGIWITNTTAYFAIRNCYVHDGWVSSSMGNMGIYFYNVINGIVENNIGENDYFCGIDLNYSDNNLVENNTFEKNFTGINISGSGNNLISNNITENNEVGIWIGNYSNNNIVTNNLVENNQPNYGIILYYYSNNNLIYHNNIVNNATQAYDSSSNYWDNGYPSGGNYWSDYTGIDNYHGENQNILGSDNIGDTPDNIPGGSNQDHYPLMNQWSPIELNLVAGWNLVCFTGVSTSDNPNNVFVPLVFSTNYIMYYWSAPSGPYGLQSSNVALKDNTGYWVWTDQNKTVMMTGTPPASENIHLFAGWNLVGFPVVDNTTTPNSLFAPLVFNTDYIMYFWNAPGGPYGLVDPIKVLKDNTGYWVDMITTAKTVTIP